MLWSLKLAPADDRITTLINARKEKFLAGKYDMEAGKAVFAKSACAQCHRIGQTGATLAPALDGIGVPTFDACAAAGGRPPAPFA